MANKLTKFGYAVVTATKRKIKELVVSELSNEDKKKQLDEYIIKMVKNLMDTLGFNFVLRFFVNKFVIPNIDDWTQIIFNLIKTRVKGVTR